MKPLVIYHADCTDGYGAAFAAWMKLGGGAEYVSMQYGVDYSKSENTFDVAGREVYILDFSFPKEVMNILFTNAKRVVWLDHHKTAFEMWEQPCEGPRYKETSKNTYIILDNNKSGALLAWEYFHPGTEVPMLIQHIDDRDRWQFKLEGSKELHAALSSYKPWSFEQWRSFINTRSLSGLPYEEGRAILRAQDQHVKSMAKQARKCEITVHVEGKKARKALKAFAVNPDPTFPGLAVNASLHQSEVGHELANQGGTYGLVWYLGSDNKVRCSLRSNGDYDVSAIAKSFGGGGHRNAAGFETDVNTLVGWLK